MKSDKPGIIPIQNFNRGGLATSKWSGVKDSLYKFIGWDPHSLPGIIQVEQKMTAETTGSEPDEFCRVAVNSSNGAQYWFSYTSGKIWERPTDETWRLVHTTTPAAGGAGCLGAAEYQGFIYWATESRLHRITVANADNNNWAADAVEDYGTFGITNASYHPMLEQNRVLYIGDGNRVAQVDAGTFSANALDIKSPYVIKSLGMIGTDLLIGTYVADNVTANKIIRWNTWSLDFTSQDTIPEVGINAFLPADNMVLIQAGNQGNIYYYDGTNLELFAKIPGNYSSTAYGEVYPNSVANKNGQILFGFSNGSGNPADELIYRIARHDRDFPYIMDQPYPSSARSGDEFVLTGLQVGALLVVGNILYAAWTNGATSWVDKLDIATKLNGAYFETRVVTVNREEQENFSGAIVAYADLPSDTGVNFYLDKNYAGYGNALDKFTDVARKIIRTKDVGTEFNALQVKIKVITSSNDGPKIESGAIVIH
jgi:hypothetical protein